MRDCIIKVEDLIDTAISLGHRVLALTDHDCLSGHLAALSYYEKIKKDNPNFKLILGNEIYLCRNGLNQDNFISGEDSYYHFILLAKDKEGHKQLREISTRAWLRSYKTGKMRRVPTYYQDLIDIIDNNKGHLIASSACFLPGQKVRTIQGDKNIEDITNEDYVLTANGTWEKINFPTSRYYNGNGNILEISKEPQVIKCTENHQFLSYDYKTQKLNWVEAKNLKKQDRILEPMIPVKYSDDIILQISQFTNIINYRKNSIGQNYSKAIYRLPNEIILTDKIMRFFGLWLADGHISKNKTNNRYNVGFTFSIKEFDIFYNSFVKQGLFDLGLTEQDYHINRRPEHNRVDLNINKVEICLLFEEIFGISHANNKYIPKRLMHINRDFDIELFFGYLLGDGYFRYRKSQGGEVVVASISYQLIKDFEQLALSFNLSGSITINKAHRGKDGVNHQESYYLTYSNAILGKELNKEKEISHAELVSIIDLANNKKGGYADFVILNGIKYRIKKIKSNTSFTINEQVYCLNTNSHNFVLNNVIVHNCLGGWLASEALALAKEWDEIRAEKIRNWCRQMVKLFGEGNFYIELQPPAEKENEQWWANKVLLNLAHELNIPWIVTTDSHYARLEDRPIHKAYLNSQDGEREVDAFYATTYMMTTEEIESYFDFSLDEAYKNIDYIASQCEDYDLRKSLKIPQLPWKNFNPKSNLYDWVNNIPLLKEFIESDYIGDVELAKAIVERLERDETLRNQKTYKAINDCLDKTWESSIVNKTHWSAYYLNLQKIIDCCWEAGSLVGPGRGSGVGFILLYLLDITQINPLRETVQTFSWRFLNPSRVSVLDVDVDIEGSKRAQVLSHLREVYGEDRVANVITFGKETSKSAILTACRGLGIEVDEAQYIASLIPADRGLIRTLSQCYYGDKENNYPIIRPFVDKMKEYPELWNVAHKIEGLICRSGIHAGGVIFVDEPFTESTSLMRAPDGTIVTGYDLHRAEDVSLIKYDLLSVEAMDKMHNCLDLLLAANKIQDKGSLRETYEEILGVYNIERNDSKMWEMVNNHEIQSLFQMEKQSGIQGIALTHPKSVEDLAHLNSIIRLMAQEKGGEQPLNKYARFKANINLWYQEMKNYGLTEQEQELLKPYLSGSYGICESQECFMQLVQIPECGGFDLTFADSLRKAIAKKNPAAYDELTKKYFLEVKRKNLSQNLCNYVWNVLVATSRGYGFNLSHTLAYSIIAVQEMNLAFKFPIVYWNCACLINDAGGEDGSTDYNKIATALGKMQKANIKISLVDINNSQYNFVPDEKQNLIWMGLKSLLNVGDDLIKDIIAKRPYSSMIDFYNRVRPNRQAMITLIKGGAFDNLSPRYDTMITYLWLTCDKKSRLTLQNLPGLIRHKILPEETEEQITARKIYEFNRYLKNECKYNNEYYKLDERALNFIYEMDYGHWIENNCFLNKKVWDKNIYQTWMDIFRNWINQDKQNILNKLNTSIFMKDWEKYASGNLSSWEMEALCFYYHPHELINVNKNKYGIVDFEQLPAEPEVEKFFKKGAVQIPIYKLHKICGTCIAKNKPKGIVYLLTTTGVVPVKLRKEHFAIFDKQISERQSDGTKKVIEKSWFNRGNMILVQGIRRGDEFVSKKYASSISHQLYHIDSIDKDGDLELRHTRPQGELEDEYI